jgi:tungstate transport system substrate-binding protein
MMFVSRSALSRLQASILIIVVVAGAAVAIYGYSVSMKPPGARLIVSTTTSLYESGLLDYLKTQYESRYPNYNVSFISQGTGLAIQTAMRGDADMILVHAPSSELPFLTGGYGVNRKIIAYNFFIIVGPKSDPAGITGKNATEALKAIRAAGEQGKAVWASRADGSGTYTKEVALWKAAGFSATALAKEPWYLSTGSGMTATLRVADQKLGYTLSDTATYLVNLKNQNINLANLVNKGRDLLNVYSAIADNPRNPNMTKSNFQGSMQFIRFLASADGQGVIARFGMDTVGQTLFGSYLQLIQSQTDSLNTGVAVPQLIKWIQSYAFFTGSECPPQFQYEAGDLYGTVTTTTQGSITAMPLVQSAQLKRDNSAQS